MVAALAVPAAHAAAAMQRFTIQPGTSVIDVTCPPGVPPLTNVRFLFAGPPEAEISRIRGNVGFPDIIFSPSVSPHEATLFFTQNPIPESQSATFSILVNNTGDRAVQLTVRISCD